MRIVFTTALLVLSLSACDRQSSDHLDKASHEAAAAVSDVGKSIDDSARAVKEAGGDIGQGVKNAADTAGDQLKQAGQKAKTRVADN